MGFTMHQYNVYIRHLPVRLLVTGCCGFIGFSLCNYLLSSNTSVSIVGIDNLNDYYSVDLKNARLSILQNYSRDSLKSADSEHSEFHFYQRDLADYDSLYVIFRSFNPTHVVNLAAQAGVRHSIDNPKAYTDSNLVGFANILQLCSISNVSHLLFASSSSVYGSNKVQPFSEDHSVITPLSYYAATKLCNEHMAILIAIYIIYLRQVLDFLPSMVPGDDLIWHYLSLRKQLLKGTRLISIITEICFVTLLI